MRRAFLTLVALGVVLAACSTVAPMDATDAPIRYVCKAGKRFTVVYALHGKTAAVTAGGVTRTLKLARSGSGARYASSGAELWGKGAAATLKGFPGGPYDGCNAP